MSNEYETPKHDGLSRRSLIRNLAVTAAVANAVRPSLAEVLNPNRDSVAPAAQEYCRIYELLALWLVLSTNPNFSQDPNDIHSATGIPLDKAMAAINAINAHRSDFEAARNTFGSIAVLYDYGPDECPALLQTLAAIKQLTPPNPCRKPTAVNKDQKK